VEEEDVGRGLGASFAVKDAQAVGGDVIEVVLAIVKDVDVSSEAV